MADTINWPDSAGNHFKYYIHEIGADFKAEGGNYIFAKKSKPGSWIPIYIGQTEDLSNRFGNHHKMDCAKQNGATHIHAHTNNNSFSRLDEERNLIQKWTPTCNG